MSTAGTVTDWTPRNAEVEALAMHVRQLIDFFWCEKPRTEDRPDAFAADYFDEGAWESVRPERPDVLSRTLRERVGWGVAPLTYRRAWSKPQDKQRPTIDLARNLTPVVLCFAESVDDAKLEPGAAESMRRSAGSFRARHGLARSSGSVATTAHPRP